MKEDGGEGSEEEEGEVRKGARGGRRPDTDAGASETVCRGRCAKRDHCKEQPSGDHNARCQAAFCRLGW